MFDYLLKKFFQVALKQQVTYHAYIIISHLFENLCNTNTAKLAMQVRT